MASNTKEGEHLKEAKARIAKSIMIQGTMSNAGKSLITAGLCRIFKQDGYCVAPFKSQNMALNSYITHEGLEMGRAQVVQAEACGIEPSVRMNPILLKPTSDEGSQVIVNGEVLGNMTAEAYFAYKTKLIPEIMKAYKSLSREVDVIVIEGAGSPAEINLNSEDIVNMGMARMAEAPVLLVADIDRGGVFASIYGTVMLLDKEDRKRIKGIMINKFRGNVDILKPGLKMIEEKVGIPVLGVVPYLSIDIEDEDSLSARLHKDTVSEAVDIAVIQLPRMSNFTDFNVFERIPGVSLRYIKSSSELGSPDMIILPGTKNTMGDLLWLRQNGLEAQIKQQVSRGTVVFGVCGGYQMLGRKLEDPDHVEHGGCLTGMELLDTVTIFGKQKTRTRVEGKFLNLKGIFDNLSGLPFNGYEIHMGETEGKEASLTWLNSVSGQQTGKADGSQNGNIMGCYVHGIFDEERVAGGIAEALMKHKGITKPVNMVNLREYKEKQYDRLAEEISKNVDMKAVYRVLEEGE